MEIEISKLKVQSADSYIQERWGVENHPNYHALKGDLYTLEGWCKVLKQDWRERLFILMWVYMFIKEEGQTKPISVDKNFRIITGHKRAAAMLVLGHLTIKVNVVDYEKIGQE